MIADSFDQRFDCFVINLGRDTARLAAFTERNRAAQIPIQRFEAVDGSRVPEADAIRDGIITLGAVNYSKGAIGVAMSHLALWRRCMDSQKNIIVFEDDAVIRRDIKSALQSSIHDVAGWDIILLGYNTDVFIEVAMTPAMRCAMLFSARYPTSLQLEEFASSTESVALLRLNVALGVCGYAISPNGARILSQNCFPMDNRPVDLAFEGRSFPAYGIDCMMTTLYPKIQAFACFTPLVMTPNDRQTSSTQTTHP